MAKDAITMFKEAAAQLQREENVKVNQLYNDIMANESMAAYNEAKAELESVMNYVNAIINTAVNGGDPMTVEEPQQGGCSGSCASCSGCH